MSRLSLPLLLLLAACAAPPQRPSPAPVPVPQRINAPDVPVLTGVPHAVRIGLTVFVSGMVPVDAAGRVVGETVESQVRQAMTNFLAVITAARGVPGDIIQMTAYVRDLTPEAAESVRATILEMGDATAPLALTIVGVDALAEPAMRVMLVGTAQLRSEFPDRTRIPQR
ncbi:MAG: RidA family protein [Gemmatimonadales bacterium]|nr:RidA family protein [Gemmatimonadales bacterium]MDZ4259891.1 RidA family protein [Gemmatimonadales bacterium]MDZ4388594.1 RidA family protein [Gemmatimonadales bacterium]